MDPRFRGFSASMNGIQMENQSMFVFPDQNHISRSRFQTAITDHQKLNNGYGPRLQNPYVDDTYNGAFFVPSDPLPSYILSTSGLPCDPSSSIIESSSSLLSGPFSSYTSSTGSLPGDPSSSIIASTSSLPSGSLMSDMATTSCWEGEDEDCDLSDAVLSYINQMLSEEDMEDKTCMLQESLELQAKEKSLYEALGKKYPLSPKQTGGYVNQNGEIPDDYISGDHRDCFFGCNNGGDYLADTSDYNVNQVQSLVASNASHSSGSSSNNMTAIFDGFLDSPISPPQASDTYNEIQLIQNFQKGVEEARKFLPSGDKLLLNVDSNGLMKTAKGKTVEEALQKETLDQGEDSPTGSRGRKNSHTRDVDLEEERSRKQAAVFTESTVRSEEFDIVLLNSMGKGEEELKAYRARLRDATGKKVQKNGQSKGSSGVKSRGKKQNGKKEVVDLRTLLISCAQAVAADDRQNVSELLKQIRLHSSPFGDGNQRLAHCFADGLEARLAGIGSQIYKGLVNKRASAADYLKAYHLYLASCPFRKISNFASNKTTMMKAKASTRVHVIDFGILYGFQWPTLFQRIARREGGPPKLRITGIEFPQPGFRPAERIEETGRRLADYARTFDVPFEYNAIAKNWENIRVEDLKLEKDEFVVVNCMYRLKNLRDERVAVDSSRDIVLNLIRKVSPDIFVHGIVNGAYGAPFFVTRFREVLFHFSSLFDMLETNVPREIPERMLIEREIFGREAMNVIACEGWERVEKPETYKQWQVRHLKMGFRQVPFERFIINMAIEKVRSSYHKDFVIYEDSQWMLLGWKGRILCALSCWKPL